jgi:hypothetical protein
MIEWHQTSDGKYKRNLSFTEQVFVRCIALGNFYLCWRGNFLAAAGRSDLYRPIHGMATANRPRSPNRYFFRIRPQPAHYYCSRKSRLNTFSRPSTLGIHAFLRSHSKRWVAKLDRTCSLCWRYYLSDCGDVGITWNVYTAPRCAASAPTGYQWSLSGCPSPGVSG